MTHNEQYFFGVCVPHLAQILLGNEKNLRKFVCLFDWIREFLEKASLFHSELF